MTFSDDPWKHPTEKEKPMTYTKTVYNPYNCEAYYCGPPPSDQEYNNMIYYLKSKNQFYKE